MPRSLRLVALALPLLLAGGTLAQTFQGLDSTPPPPKKTKPKPSTTSTTKPASATQTSGQQGLGLDLTTPAPPPAKTDLPMPPPPPSKKGTAPTTTFEALDVSGRTADRQRLEAANASFQRGEYDKAALAAWELMNDPKMAPLQLEAQYLLAKTLYRMGQYHSSLGEFSQILARGQDTQFFSKSLEWLFFISHKTVNESVILDEIAKYANARVPGAVPGRVPLPAGALLLRARPGAGHGGAEGRGGQELRGDAQADRCRSPRATASTPGPSTWRGSPDFRDRNDCPAALEAMKEVVRVTAARAGSERGGREDRGRDARAGVHAAGAHPLRRQAEPLRHLLLRQDRAREAEWLEALFESSWADYRIGQYEQALGNLITLSRPFFRDEYFPEALILKAVIYYENCRYRESTAIVEEFERLYMPVHDAAGRR